MPWYAWLIGGILGALLVGGLACAALGAAVGGIIGHVAIGPEETTAVTRTFAVSGTPDVTIRNATGSATIVSGRDGTVKAVVTKKARGGDPQVRQRDLNDISVTFTQLGNAVIVSVQYPSGLNLQRQLSADVLLTVPPTTHLDAQVTTGTVEATNVTLAGLSRIEVTTGNVTLRGAMAPAAAVEVRVTTGNAGVTVPANTSAHLDASTVTGNVAVNGWPIPVTGTITRHNASGDLSTNPTGSLTVHVITGNVTVSSAG